MGFASRGEGSATRLTVERGGLRTLAEASAQPRGPARSAEGEREATPGSLDVQNLSVSRWWAAARDRF